MSTQNYYEIFYTMSVDELTDLIVHSKSEDETRFYFMILDFMSEVKQKKVMAEEKY